jgi:uncharacterized membrane protein
MIETKPTHRTWFGLLASGFFIALPLLLLGLLIKQIFLVLQGIIQPLLDVLPGTVFKNPTVRFLLVCLAIALLLMLIGLLAQTRMGRAIGGWLESKVLNRIPFYSLLRNLAVGMTGRDDAESLKPVRVTVDVPGLEQWGFIMERHADGSATVFLPSSPNPSSGTVVIVEPARLREVPRVPGRKVLMCLGRWGAGSAALLEKEERINQTKQGEAP